jgi:hypothetical protein
MEEIRAPIIGFPTYEVSNLGKVYNIRTGREMVLSPTEEGTLTVGLMYDGTQYRRSVKVLVARAFVKGENDIFDTPIQLDNDKRNCRAENILWRPRGFAWEYTHQFDSSDLWYYTEPVLDIVSGEVYDNILEAATINGLLCKDVRQSIFTTRRVFPTGQQFIWTKSRSYNEI